LYKSRKEAEAGLLAQLKIVSESGDAIEVINAKRNIGKFNELINSKKCDDYWDNRDIKFAKKRTEKRRIIHDQHIEYNVYQEHDVHSTRITNLTEKRKDVSDEDDSSPPKKVMTQSSSSL